MLKCLFTCKKRHICENVQFWCDVIFFLHVKLLTHMWNCDFVNHQNIVFRGWNDDLLLIGETLNRCRFKKSTKNNIFCRFSFLEDLLNASGQNQNEANYNPETRVSNQIRSLKLISRTWGLQSGGRETSCAHHLLVRRSMMGGKDRPDFTVAHLAATVK